MRLEANLEALLSIVELVAIRRHRGLLTIARTRDDGWTVSLGDGNGGDAARGESLKEALQNAIVPANKKPEYKDFDPNPQKGLF